MPTSAKAVENSLKQKTIAAAVAPEATPQSTPNANLLARPKWNDPEDVQQKYINALNSKYKSLPNGQVVADRADWGRWLPYSVKGKPLTIQQAVSNTAQQQGLRPELLYASAMEEGFRQMFPNSRNPGKFTGFSGNDEYPIDGYGNFGLDTFTDAFPGLVKKGYLPAEFEKNFIKHIQPPKEGDNKVPVNSADFKGVDDALLAKAAMIRDASDNVNEYAAKKGVTLSPKAKEFFTLVNYNAGSGNAQKMLDSYNQSGYLKDDAFLKKRPSESWKGVYDNVMRRMVMADVMKQEGYFPEQKKDDKATNAAVQQAVKKEVAKESK